MTEENKTKPTCAECQVTKMPQSIGQQALRLATTEQNRRNAILVQCQVEMMTEINTRILATAKKGNFGISVCITTMLKTALEDHPNVRYSTERAEDVRIRLKYYYDNDTILRANLTEHHDSRSNKAKDLLIQMDFSWKPTGIQQKV